MAPKKNKNQNISESDKESESLPEKETSIRKQKSSLKKRNRNEAFNSRSDSDSDFEEPQEAEGEYHSRLTSALEDSELSILQFLTKEKLRKDKKGLNPVEIKIQVMKVFGALKIEIAERSKNLGKVYKTWRKKQIGSFYALKKGNKRLKLLPSTGVDGTFHQSNPELLIPEISVSTAEKQNENLDCIPSETADNISKEKKHASVMEISAEEEFTLKGKSTSGSEKVACRSERSFDLSEENSEKFGFSDFDDIEVEDRLTSDTEVEFEKNLRAIELEFENSRKNSPQLGENLSKDFVNSQVLDNNLPRNSNKDSPRVSEKNSSGIIGKNSILSQSNSPRVSETRSPRVSKNNSPRISEKNSTPISERNSLPISERSSPPISEKSSPPISEKSSRTISERNSSPISENNSLLISEKSSPPISEKNSTPISEKNFDDESEKERSITKSPALDSQESKISEEFLLPCDQIEKNSRKSDESQSMKSAENDSNAYLDDLIRRNLEEESDEDFRDVDLEAEQGKRKDREEKNGTDKKEKDKSPKEDLLSQKDHSNFSKRHEDFESEELEITNFIFNMDKDSDCEMKSYFEKNLRSKTAEDKLSGSISSKEKSPAKIIEEKSVEGKTTANEISEEKSAEEISEEMIAHRGKEMENSEEKISESIDKGKEIENLEEKIFEKVDEGKEIANSEQNISEEMIADKGKESKNSEQNIFEGMIVDKPNKIENSEENLDMENSEIKNAEEKLKIENSENSKVRSPVWKEKGLEAVNSELIRNEIDSVPKKSAREENPDVPSSVSKQMKEKSPEVSSSELISNGIDSIPKETAREKSPEIDNSELITNKIDSMPIETEEEKSPKVQSPISKEKSPVVPNSELIANEDDSVWKDEDSESREEIGVTEASNKEKNQKTECKSPTIENSPQKKSEESKKEATELNSSILARLKNICDSSSDSENSPVSKITRKHADESSPEKKNFKTHSPSLTQGSRKKKFKRLLTPGSQKQISRSSVNSQEINEKKIRESELAVDKEEDLNLIAKEDILKSSEPSDSSTDSDSNDSDKSGKSTSTKSSSEKEVKKRRYEKLVRSSDSETSRFKSRRKKQRTSKEKDDSIKEYRLAERKQEINQDNIIDISLANLERRRKQFSPNTSSDEEDTNVKDVRKTLFRNRKSLLKKRDESLLDHLENVENGTANYEPMEDLPPAMEVDSERGKIMTNQELFAEADISAKKILLNSSGPDSDDEVLTDDKSDNVENRSANKKSDSEKCNHARENKLKAKRSKGKIDQASELISEDGTDLVTDDTDSDVNNILTDDKNTSESEEEVGRRSVDKFHRIPKDDSTWETKELEDFKKKLEDETTQKASEEETKRLKRLKKRRLRRMILSETEIELSEESKDVEKDSDSNTDNFKKKKKERSWFDLKRFVKKKKSKNRKRLKNVDNSRHELERVNSNGLATAGRKNIRKVLTDRELDEETRRADKKEKERLKRIAEREKLFEEERQIIQNKKGNKLVLDIDERTKEELITVHKDLVKYLKPHQAQGVKFMWDACFESLERMKTSSGSGCILAHCMGLGKTFQVVTLSHTLLTHKQSGIKTILVVVPLSTASNWYSEYQMWLRDVNKGNDFAVYEMKSYRQTRERKFLLETWQKTGGVMIIGYEMYRNLTKPYNKKIDERTQNVMMNCFVDPGPDLIVCDEAHLLKNENSATSIAIKKVRTCRRIALTGTPLQNNLKEYHCMVQFIKPNLLGSKTEFMNRFGNPIDNGQYEDSDPSDVRLMKNRAFVLLEKLKGCVQRFDYTVLTPFLPPKQEYVIYVRLSEVQIQMYQYYLDHFVSEYGGRRLFADFQALQRVMTHPRVVQMYDEIMEKKQNQNQKRLKRKGKSKKTPKPLGEEDADLNDDDSELKEDPRLKGNFDWWKNVVKEADLQNLNVSSKLQLLFGILNECEKTGEKLLVFSKGLLILDIVEEFLEKINKATKKQTSNENLGGHKGRWKLGKDYFRMDGKVNMDLRSAWCNEFNKQSNKRARLFLISTRAGSLGINLTAANRVIIFDASWNPSHDLQAIFRIYRFGQRKPCYVYRFIALGTMEERIYNRQITKLSLAGRVIDEKQIERHYKRRDLAELYRLEPKGENPRQDMLNPPKDRLLAEIFSKYGELVERYLEHDSLLANKEDEVLDEEDRKRAWVEYEDEKSGKKMFQVKQEIDESYLSQVYNPTDLGETTNELDRIPSPVASLSRASSTNDVGSLSSSNSHYSDAEDVGANDTSSISSAKTAKVPYITKSPPKSREVTESLEPISSFLKRLEI